ncbi:MAG: hypothetical protein U0795_02025 [Pirellulales bacterium]
MATHAHVSRAYVVHLRHQHRELDRLALDAEQIMRTHWNRGRSDLGQSGVAIEKLIALRDQLERHCNQESAGGCLEDAVCGRPELAQAATRWEQETRSLIVDLTDLIDGIRGRRIAVDAGGRRFSELADRLRQHQAEENRLLGEAYGLEMADGKIVP